MGVYPSYKNTYVLLLGSGKFDRDPDLAPIPNVKTNIKELSEIFLDPKYMGIEESNLNVGIDLSLVDTKETLKRIAQLARFPNDALIVYYTGHGVYSNVSYAMHLTTADTDRQYVDENCLRIDNLRDIVKSSGAGVKILIIDSCFSGAVHELKSSMSSPESHLMATFKDTTGIYILSSSTEQEQSFFDSENPESPTKFTEKIIQIIKTGLPTNSPVITMNELYNEVDLLLKQETKKQTPGKTAQGKAENFPFVKNVMFIDHSKEWADTLAKNTKKAYQEFIQKFPNSAYAKEAQNLLQNLIDRPKWEKLAKEQNTSTLEEYVLQNPNSTILKSVNAKLRRLTERQDWLNALKEDSINGYKFYLSKHPRSKKAELTREYLKTLEQEEVILQAWKITKNQNSIAAYKAFKAKFPESLYTHAAEIQIDLLEQKEAAKQMRKENARKRKLKEKNKLWRFTTKAKLIKAILSLFKKDPNTKILTPAQKKKLEKLNTKKPTKKTVIQQNEVNQKPKQKPEQKPETNTKTATNTVGNVKKYAMLIAAGIGLLLLLIYVFKPNPLTELKENALRNLEMGQWDSAVYFAGMILEISPKDTLAIRIINTHNQQIEKYKNAYATDMKMVDSIMQANNHIRTKQYIDSLIGIYPSDSTLKALRVQIDTQNENLFYEYLRKADNLATREETYNDAKLYYAKAMGTGINNAVINQRLKTLNQEIDLKIENYLNQCQIFLNNLNVLSTACENAKKIYEKARRLNPNHKRVKEFSSKMNC